MAVESNCLCMRVLVCWRTCSSCSVDQSVIYFTVLAKENEIGTENVDIERRKRLGRMNPKCVRHVL